MDFLQKYFDWWKTVWACPFQRGICCGIAAVLLLWLLWKFVKLAFFLCFGPRRCRSVIVSGKDGEISITAEAVYEAVYGLLKSFRDLDVRKLMIYRRGRKYQLSLRCHYHGGRENSGLPALAEKLRPLLTKRLEEIFGIRNLSCIVIRVESYDGPAETAASLPPSPESREKSEEDPVL